MSVVGAVAERSDRPAYVRFKIEVLENKAESLKQGKYVGRDVHFALITPPYSKDCIPLKIEQWKLNMEQDVREGRMPPEWRDNYLKQYEAWKKGEELPPVGTPIKGWGVISPSQQEMLVRINILTVEDLAGLNDEGARRIGMGALELKNKAVAWVAQLKDKGPLTQEVAALKTENDSLKGQVASLLEKVERLSEMMAATQQIAPVAAVSRNVEAITADDILPESDKPTRRK